MKKLVAVCCIVALLVTLCPLASEAKVSGREPGGLGAFFVGCCLGLRTGTEWNAGSQLHWREWSVLIPYAGLIIAVWNGIDCAKGMTAHQWAEKNGANWY
ncbi:hypothetical protein [Desulfonema magnum]|uniref:Lipoprotein n=1 Tax=Desulfonema magnum TaxID=45655 RepID=A0A975BVN0_9BACT|nr:hypothetical protein [Desulfonema magnum]QTA92660.1 Uncharacterized protein dnm_087470 [Desulfonema magnum]